jgi:hypothetical protein
LEKKIEKNVTDPKKVIKYLEKLKKNFEILEFEKRITFHIFEHIAFYIDAFLVNYVRNADELQPNDLISVKMGLSYYIHWFEEIGGKFLINKEKEMIFPLTHQFCDSLIILKADNTTDVNSLKEICKKFSDDEFKILFKNEVNENYTNDIMKINIYFQKFSKENEEVVSNGSVFFFPSTDFLPSILSIITEKVNSDEIINPKIKGFEFLSTKK